MWTSCGRSSSSDIRIWVVLWQGLKLRMDTKKVCVTMRLDFVILWLSIIFVFQFRSLIQFEMAIWHMIYNNCKLDETSLWYNNRMVQIVCGVGSHQNKVTYSTYVTFKIINAPFSEISIELDLHHPCQYNDDLTHSCWVTSHIIR